MSAVRGGAALRRGGWVACMREAEGQGLWGWGACRPESGEGWRPGRGSGQRPEPFLPVPRGRAPGPRPSRSGRPRVTDFTLNGGLGA